MDFALLVFLILINGLFAMSEMALAASRKARLQVLVDTGDKGAIKAMELHDHPTSYLSTVQIGITSIGLLNGIVGEAVFAPPLGEWMQAQGLAAHWADVLSTAMVVVGITFISIVLGELVPKRIGQMYPEAVARLVSRPMHFLSLVGRPFVRLLIWSTDAVLKLLGVHSKNRAGVTQEEIDALLEEGSDSGLIEAQEHQMVRNVFRLDDREISSLMVPRSDILWLDADLPLEQALKIIAGSDHSRFPVCRGGLADVLGVLSATQLLNQSTKGLTPSLLVGLDVAVFVPETLSGMELLEQFRSSDVEMVFVVDEYGEIQGLVTLQDVLEAITGEFKPDTPDHAWAVKREDGSWLMDGLIPIPELKDHLDLKEAPDEALGRYNTLAGMLMYQLGELPRETDHIDWEDWRFEVVDMDGRRVDKVMVSKKG